MSAAYPVLMLMPELQQENAGTHANTRRVHRGRVCAEYFAHEILHHASSTNIYGTFKMSRVHDKSAVCSDLTTASSMAQRMSHVLESMRAAPAACNEQQILSGLNALQTGQDFS